MVVFGRCILVLCVGLIVAEEEEIVEEIVEESDYAEEYVGTGASKDLFSISSHAIIHALVSRYCLPHSALQMSPIHGARQM
jgi:hypothetical protein